MSEFSKKFLLEDLRVLNPASRRNLFLAAFGKHPGWDDHIEDLGLETESLILAKKLLYLEGIGGQVNSGEWERLEAAQQIPGFKHLLVWLRGNQFIIGRIWSSSDGKGRTRYPMIVCVHCSGSRLAWALDEVLPRLQKIERECVLTRSAADVRQVLNRFRNDLRLSLGSVETTITPVAVSSSALSQFVDHPSLGPNAEGWFRILYQTQSQMAGFAPGKYRDGGGLRPQQVRVPACGQSEAETLLLWSRFFQCQLDPATPLLLTLPLEESWVDATVGEPGPAEFFCLRATPKALPLVSEVPYNLDDNFRAGARQLLKEFQARGITAEPPGCQGQPAPAASGLTSVTQRFFKWLGGGSSLL